MKIYISKYPKCICMILILNLFSFIYLEQRMTLIKENYRQSKMKEDLKKEVFRKEEMVYTIARLETPSSLQTKLFSANPNFNAAKSVRVVRVPYTQPVEEEETPILKGVSFANEIP